MSPLPTPSSYHYFIGVDSAKFEFVASSSDGSKPESFKNTDEGFEAFAARYQKQLSSCLVVLENTGGCEYGLVAFLLDRDIAVHRAHASQIKAYIRSLGISAKTDNIDAKSLSVYAQERHAGLARLMPPDKTLVRLRSLASRRNDLMAMQVQEKNRYKSPGCVPHKASIDKHLEFLASEIAALDGEIDAIFQKQPELQAQVDVLDTVPGIAQQTGKSLLVFLPELGHLDRKKIASLVGLAPVANDSGTKQGYRKTKGGRAGVKPLLFLAAMGAARSKSELGVYYRGLLQRGKKKMVALTALMRRILVIANARLRDYYEEKNREMLSAA